MIKGRCEIHLVKTTYQHKRINTNNETKSLKVKYTVKVIILK